MHMLLPTGLSSHALVWNVLQHVINENLRSW